MIIHYGRRCLKDLIKDIFDLTGISISVLDVDRNVQANCSRSKDYCTQLQSIEGEDDLCFQCDKKILDRCRQTKKLEFHICRAGLCDAAMPIIKYDQLVGYVLMGRVRSAGSPATPKYIPAVPLEQIGQLQKQYQKLPVLTQKQLSALYNLLPSILFDRAISIIYDPFMNEVLEYIQAHLQEQLTVQTLCEKFHVSANYLYEAFRKNLDCTVNEYIMEQRIRRAQAMLTASNEPVYAIAEKVGIGNYPYFCRFFKKRTGMSPMEYRKTSRSR